MFNLALRNMKIYFRNKATVFFSLMGVFIIILLYILFLGDTLSSSYASLTGSRFLMDSWIMAGVISVASITTTMGAFEIMVSDRENKRLKDFYAAPIKKTTIVLGYLISSVTIGLIMSIISFVLAETYIVAYGGQLLNILSLFKLLLVVILSVIASSSMVFFLVSFLKNSNAFGAASAIIGSLIGFLTGIYIPIGILPNAVQWVIKIFPVSHSAVLLRKIMMAEPISRSFAGADVNSIIDFKKMMGIDFYYGKFDMTVIGHFLILVLTATLFYILTVIKISEKNKKGK